MSTKELIEEEIEKLEKESRGLKKLRDEKTLSKGFECLDRTNKAIRRHIKENREEDLKWADIWDKGRKHFIKKAEAQTDNNYWMNETHRIDNRIRSLKNDLYYLKLLDNEKSTS